MNSRRFSVGCTVPGSKVALMAGNGEGVGKGERRWRWRVSERGGEFEV
jgi:hypothetical protein